WTCYPCARPIPSDQYRLGHTTCKHTTARQWRLQAVCWSDSCPSTFMPSRHRALNSKSCSLSSLSVSIVYHSKRGNLSYDNDWNWIFLRTVLTCCVSYKRCRFKCPFQ